ncbi:hypothetical protein TRAPUB_4262 [Trametes pubescens]|uniref:Heterokaryon incompatibility domain-containing protein n=1 Tax=Trametes pubescens TaxID=154538 RepID=A0A1M2VB76_TRAPU|nr:hypothetical protein TRAPUB_4262 [Trametes pubescens]
MALESTSNLLDLSHTAPCRIRLVDCKSVVEHGLLRVVDFAEFPTIAYAAISYPWRGVSINPSDTIDSAFSVRGAEHADPVGVDALRSACAAALGLSCAYLWVDRLSIIQTNKTDKTWQIRNMYKVYRSCRVCVVLAGGLRRLVRLDEETPWIHRSWTLQEVLAPPSTVVLIHWKLGPGRASSGGISTPVSVEEAVPDASAYIPLPLVLQVCTTGTLSFTSTPSAPHLTRSTMVKACIFSALQQDAPRADEIPFWQPQRRIFSPNVVAVAVALDDVLVASDPEIRSYAVWQSALMRTSSRPVDMVLSIMGLFGVELDPGGFHENDRRGATVALAQAILAAGGCASWMGAAFRLDPDQCLSTFPQFPRTSVAGAALVRTKEGIREVSQLVGPVYPIQDALVPLPRGRMDAEGYVTFTAKGVPLVEVLDTPGPDHPQPSEVFQALDGSRWRIRDDSPSSPTDKTSVNTYAILLGWFHKYHPGASPANGETILVIIAQQHLRQPVRFHIRSFLTLRASHKPQVLRWPDCEFCVGGPDPLAEGKSTAVAKEEHLVETYVDRDAPWPRMPWSKPIVTAEDEAVRKARWAAPQQVLERHWHQD